MPVHAQAAWIETVGSPREAERHKVSLAARGSTASADAAEVLIRNLSRTGLLLETTVALSLGEELVIDLPYAGRTHASVVWANESLFGCQFKRPISAAAVSAARLLNPIDVSREDPVPAFEAAAAASDAPLLSDRIRELREQRGLTLTELARKIAVSRPTLWAWETGRRQPKPTRLDAIARALGLSASELRFGGSVGTSGPTLDATNGTPDESEPTRMTPFGSPVSAERRLPELIAASKEQIAALAGTEAAKVTIIIET